MPDRTAPDNALDEAVDAFLRVRPRLFGIAHRILGSTAEAEDVLQDVWVRWQNTDRSQVLVPPAFLARMTTHLAINVTRSARRRLESCAGSRLPQRADPDRGPEAGVEQEEALETAVRLLLERLTPTERAAYVLREAFVYPHTEIAVMLRLSHVHTRQLVSRARRRLTVERRESVDAAEHRHFVRAFVTAARSGEMAALEQLLTVAALGGSRVADERA
jgi:RNA polymerase sigma-70 factor (ECF subfamily)